MNTDELSGSRYLKSEIHVFQLDSYYTHPTTGRIIGHVRTLEWSTAQNRAIWGRMFTGHIDAGDVWPYIPDPMKHPDLYQAIVEACLNE